MKDWAVGGIHHPPLVLCQLPAVRPGHEQDRLVGSQGELGVGPALDSAGKPERGRVVVLLRRPLDDGAGDVLHTNAPALGSQEGLHASFLGAYDHAVLAQHLDRHDKSCVVPQYVEGRRGYVGTSHDLAQRGHPCVLGRLERYHDGIVESKDQLLYAVGILREHPHGEPRGLGG